MRVRAKIDFEMTVGNQDSHYGIVHLKGYFVIEISEKYYRVINDLGEPVLYPKSLFEVIDRSIPSNWCFVDYPDGEYHLAPAPTNIPGFYEDYFCSDGDHVAQARAKRTLLSVLEVTLNESGEEDGQLLRRDLAILSQALKSSPLV